MYYTFRSIKNGALGGFRRGLLLYKDGYKKKYIYSYTIYILLRHFIAASIIVVVVVFLIEII